MKKFLLLILMLLLIGPSNTFALEILKPNLINQMKYQEEVQKKNRILEKKQSNIIRLAEIRKSKSTTYTKIASEIKTPTTISSSYWAKKPVIQQSAAKIYAKNTTSNISGVDISRVGEQWFDWYNDYRASLWLANYTHDSRLDATAHDWNIVFSQSKWQNHHTRNTGDGYYNFNVIDRWFTARGIDPKVMDWSKHTENVWYGYYSCSQSECTDELISSIRSTFDFFMSEKGKSYDAHYRSIINPYFTKMGFDIIVIPNERRYYITIHYVTTF